MPETRCYQVVPAQTGGSLCETDRCCDGWNERKVFFSNFYSNIIPIKYYLVRQILLYQLYPLSFVDPSEIKRMERGWMKRGRGEAMEGGC